jgi:hypothetical protein
MKLNKLGLGIVAAAITATAISGPAKAETNKELNTLLILLGGGLVINEIMDRKKDRGNKVTNETVYHDRDRHRDTSITHRHDDGRWYTHNSKADLNWYHRNDRNRRLESGIVADRDSTYDRSNRKSKRKHADKLPMPKKCERTVRLRNGDRKKAYNQRCLKKRGYKVTKRGNVSHPKWPRLLRRPNLI